MKSIFKLNFKITLLLFLIYSYLSLLSCYSPNQTISYSAIKSKSKPDNTSPEIVLINPRLHHDQKTVKVPINKELNIEGYVFDQSDIKRFSINGSKIDLNRDNTFSYKLYVQSSITPMELVAFDSYNNKASKKFKISGANLTQAPEAIHKPNKFSLPPLVMSEKRTALIIGNSNYKDTPLRNPVNDANDFSIALQRCGFDVKKTINANRRQMRESIRIFGNSIRKSGVGLFYYAGHGIQLDGENYLVPIDAAVESEDEIKDECLMVSSVLRKMETARNKLNIIILDACRNNPFASKYRSATRGLAIMDAPTGSLLAYSTAPGSVASDGPNRNGLYTYSLLKHLNTPGLRLIDLFINVRNDVVTVSNGKQVPWESQSLRGHFYFIPTKSKP
jgi:hypothetical protein